MRLAPYQRAFLANPRPANPWGLLWVRNRRDYDNALWTMRSLRKRIAGDRTHWLVDVLACIEDNVQEYRREQRRKAARNV